MARQKKVIAKILKLLNQKPLKKGDIRNILKINRKTEYENLKLAMYKKWIEIDDLGFYHITTLGKRHAESLKIPIDSFDLEAYTQVLGFLPIHSEKPRVNCIIEIEKADKIKELDQATKAELRFLTNDGLWLPENDTNLKASIACVADSLLDNVAKNKGLFTILDEEFRKETTVFNFRDRQPGYDYRKRLRDLARTNFQILIEYNGEDWVKKHNFENMEKYLENSQQRYNKYLNEVSKWKKRQKINKAIQMIDQNNYKVHEYRLHNDGLFKTEEDAKSFISRYLKRFKYKSEKEIKQITEESFNSGFLKINKREFYCLELNKENRSKFYKSISPILNEE
ncbi:MAG TPA: hypothetical protein VFP49_09705 [Nitrososphaeraceae archaeon]|nr:hypothetical protein [Nitrososphaeraceae archaeon]